MTQEFVEAFITECFKHGISKEAAAALLVRESVSKACAESPGFAEGYTKVASRLPSGLQPRFTSDFLEKSAVPGPGFLGRLKAIGSGFGQGFKNLGGLIFKDPALAANRGAKRVNTGMAHRQFITNNPLPVAVGAASLGGGLAYGAHKMFGQGSDLSPGDFLYMPPGGYNPSESSKYFDNLLDQHSKGIADLNTRYHGSAERRKQLQEAVDNNLPNSDMALAELRKLEMKRAIAGKQRDQYLDSIDRSGAASAAKLKEIEERQNKMEKAKTSIWRMPQRAWLRLTGRKPDAYFDNEVNQLESAASRNQTNLKLREEERRRIVNGYVGGSTKSQTPSEMQQRFFPTYD